MLNVIADLTSYASSDDGFTIDPNFYDYSPRNWQDASEHLDAKHTRLHPQRLKSKRKYMPFITAGRTAGERSWIAPKGLQRGGRAL
ncbi:hypothetical protein [Bradyrhizobium sp. CCBAU 051011]|uniref:hypothetical protein n=1 Tax=Bradyrhizobium sp. CCBAU 051011 TaxID=858422 RepID=UPI00137A63B0|nr:hypothetical protein [Bradyrhizobium sp. CCBAU 051011]